MENQKIVMNFDIAKSLEMSPPNYPEGVEFIERALVKITSIGRTIQVREIDTDPENVRKILNSYLLNGYDYEQPVKVVEYSQTGANVYDLNSGYNRICAETEMGLEYTMVDIVRFVDTEEWNADAVRVLFMLTENVIETPRKENTVDGILKSTIDAIAAGTLDKKNDNQIKKFILQSAPDKTKGERERIFREVRKEYPTCSTIRVLDSERAIKLCKELNLQYGGRKVQEKSNIAYYRNTGYSKQIFWDALKEAEEVGIDRFAPVTIYGYISDAKPNTLKKKRMKWMEDFKQMNEKLIKIVTMMTDITEDEMEKRFATGKSFKPFQFGGFLPQVFKYEKDVNVGETGLVDANGNPFMTY